MTDAAVIPRYKQIVFLLYMSLEILVAGILFVTVLAVKCFLSFRVFSLRVFDISHTSGLIRAGESFANRI